MRNVIFAVLFGSSLISFPMLTGCDKDKEATTKSETVTHPDGTKTIDKEKSSTDANGNTSTSTEHKTTP